MSEPIKKNPVVDTVMLILVALILFALGTFFAGYLASKTSIICSRLNPSAEQCIFSQKNFFEYKKKVIPINQISAMDFEMGRKRSVLAVKTSSQGVVYPGFVDLKGSEERKILDDFNAFLKDKNQKTFEASTDYRITFYCVGAAFLTTAIMILFGLIVRIIIFFCDMFFKL